MYAETAVDLIRELDRTTDAKWLPTYNEHHLTRALQEVNILAEENSKDAAAVTDAGEADLYRTILWRHAAIERNKRCILAYLNARLERLKRMRWDLGSVLPAEIRGNVSELESQWFNGYGRLLASYMRSIGPTGLDLTQDRQPPKSVYVQVHCVKDYGEFETQDGVVVLLKTNSRHFLLRSDAEPLIRQGYLVHQIE